MLRRVLLGVVLALGSVAGLTYWAGEQTEVAVLRTRDVDGSVRETKLWVVDHEGTPWVRVANPRRGWFARLRDRPQVELLRGGRTQACEAHVHEGPETRAAIDAAFRARYGIVDWWYGLLLRRGAIPVQLVPREPNGAH
jgi:hypothetical protein